MEKGAARAKRDGKTGDAGFFGAKAKDLRKTLDGFWAPDLSIYKSRILGLGSENAKALDFSVILGVLHAGLDKGLHSVQDETSSADLQKTATNSSLRNTPSTAVADTAVMFGRYKGDSYVSGGAYYFSTFGAAEFYYRAAAATPSHRAALIERGDAVLSRLRDFIPESGGLSEQFDQTSGEQTSAKDLSWSYACFITAWQARRIALGERGLV